MTNAQNKNQNPNLTQKLTQTIAAATLLSACATAPSPATATALQGRSHSAEARILEFESGPEGFNTKNFFYDNGQEVIVFDTQFTAELAEKSIAAIRAQTSNPITTVVITHPNPDKFNGASAFQRLGAKVIASRSTANSIPGTHAYKKYFFEQVAKMFPVGTYPQEARIDQTFEGAFDLVLRNGETIRLEELSAPGVSTTQTVAWIPRANALFVGDLVHHKAHAWLEGGIKDGSATPTLAGWIQGLRELQTRFPGDAMVFGGRGQAARLSEVASQQEHYLRVADRVVSEYLASLANAKAELTGPKASEHYAQIQKRMENAFPAYSLGYMIQYGVYGLVNSKL